MLILPKFLIDLSGQPQRSGRGVRVHGDVIVAVAPHDELRQRFPDDELLGAPGCTLSPGFVNAHAHLYGLLAHGLPLDKAPSGFWPFLEDFWWPLVEDRLDHELICAATDAILLEMLRSGVTTVYDRTEAPYALPGCLAAQAEVGRDRGPRAVLSFAPHAPVGQENGQKG